MVSIIAEVVAQIPQPPTMTANQYFVLQLLIEITALIAAILSILNHFSIRYNTKRTIDTNQRVNGRMEDQLRLTAEAAYAKGVLDTKAQSQAVSDQVKQTGDLVKAVADGMKNPDKT